MRHADFAALLPSQKRTLIEAAVEALAFPARLVYFSSGVRKEHTYVSVELSGHRNGVDEYVTWLVCPQNVGAVNARTGRHTGEVYLDSGHYGFRDEAEALADLFSRVNR